MQTKLEQLEQRRLYLQQQVGFGPQIGIESESEGALQCELSSVKEKLSKVTVDVPNEEIITLQQQEAVLAVKIRSGKAELKSVSDEISRIRQNESQARELIHSKQEAKQKKLRAGLDQIADIDALLSGRKLFPPLPVTMGMASSDYQDTHRNRCEVLKRERARLVEEFGSPEEYEISKKKERAAEIGAMLAGSKQFPELPCDVQQHARRYDMSGKDGYLEAQRKAQRKALEDEREALLANK